MRRCQECHFRGNANLVHSIQLEIADHDRLVNGGIGSNSHHPPSKGGRLTGGSHCCEKKQKCLMYKRSKTSPKNHMICS